VKEYVKIAAVAVSLVAVVATLTYGKTVLGLAADIDVSFAVLLPGLAIVGVGCVMVAITPGVFKFPSFFMIGLGVAVLLGEMNSLSLLTPTMLEGLTVAQLQVWVIVVSLIFGALAAFVTTR
jgi:hypothetical protein